MIQQADLRRFMALPEGSFGGHSNGRTYRVIRHSVAQGAGWKLQAWEAGGGDYISLNLYLTSKGALLRPCETSVEKVLTFLRDLSVR